MDSTIPSAKATVEGEKESQAQTESTTTDDTQSTEVPAPAQGEPTSSALVIHSACAKPPTKKLKVVMDIPNIPTLTPLNTFKLITIDSILIDQYIASLFSLGLSDYAIHKKGGSAPSLPNLQHFRAVRDRPMTMEDSKLQMQEAKSLADLKDEREKAEKKIRRILTPEQLRAQEEKLAFCLKPNKPK
ncbi:hypothetical protein Tco_0701593 [Tanacetum coccineum]